MSVVAEIVPLLEPPLLLKTTVRPPALCGLPTASRTVKVKVTGEPAAADVDETPIVEFATETEPGVTVSVGKVVVTAEPLIAEVILVAEPEMLPVKLAV